MPAKTTDTPKVPKTASDFAAPAPRVSPYRYASAAKRAPFGKGFVVRGVRVARNDKEKDTPTLLYVSGDAVTPASQLAQIGAAIQHKVIGEDEITYLQSL